MDTACGTYLPPKNLPEGTLSWFHLGYTLAFTVVIMLWGMVTFNRVQRSFMDVI